MKTSHRLIALLCIAMASIAAHAMGLDVAAAAATHADTLAGLSMLAVAGQIDGVADEFKSFFLDDESTVEILLPNGEPMLFPATTGEKQRIAGPMVPRSLEQ
jgi:hypothetical protein